MSPIEFCEECGAELEAGAKFCEKCGKPVVSEIQPPAESVPPPLLQSIRPQTTPPRPPPTPQQIPTPQYRSTPPAKKSFPLKFIIIGIVCLVVLCGLLAVALGVGWFSVQSDAKAINITSSPVLTITRTMQSQTAIPPTAITATEIPNVNVSRYLSRISTLLVNYVAEYEKFDALFEMTDVEVVKDTIWRNDTYSAFDRVIEAAGNLANEPSPVDFETIKFNFSKAYEEFIAAQPDLHNGIDNFDVDSLNSFSSHLKKANEYINNANAAMPQSDGGETPAVSIPEITEEQGGARDLSGFRDDFSTYVNTWKIVSDTSNGTAVIENGELTLTVTKPDQYLSVQVPWYLTNPVTDVTLSMTATVKTPEMGYFGLFCRAFDKNNFYMISIRPKVFGGGEYRFYKNLKGEISYLNDWEYTTLLYGGEIPEEVTFSCRGNKLRLEVNGELVDEVTDSDIKSGSAYLFALSMDDVDADNPFRISFDNFEATIP